MEAQASEIEEKVFRTLANLQLAGSMGSAKVGSFLNNATQVFLSSPVACLETVGKSVEAVAR